MLNWRRLAPTLCALYALLRLCTSEIASDPTNKYIHAHISNCSKIFPTLDVDFDRPLPVILADLVEHPYHWFQKHPGVLRSFDDLHATTVLSTNFYDLPHSYVLQEMIGNAEAVLQPLRYYRTHFRAIDRMALEELAHSAFKPVGDNGTLVNSNFTFHPSITWTELQFVGIIPSPFYLVYLSMTCWLITIHAFLRIRFLWILYATSR
uniref:Glycoprotein 2 n=1 Tax=Wobbly possum disease virus TaxID=1118369 RepID=A0A6M3Q8R5_9NIDO|nr:glycoprotein 2 [Wobbly possum disease virus]